MEGHHHVPKPEHHHKAAKKIRINKDLLLMASLFVIIILIALTVFSFVTKPKTAASGQMLYLYPSSCTADVCNPKSVSDLVKQSVQAFKADFIRVPVLLLPQKDTMNLIQADTNKAITTGLCDAGLKDYCAQTAKYACEGITKSDKPSLKLFYMSFCPYGIQAFQGLYPVLKLMGSKIGFEPHFVIYENYQGGSDQYCINGGKICSMHGVSEVNEDIRQMCVYKDEGLDKYLEYTKCVMDSCQVSNVDTCWKTCASKNSLDAAKIESCQTTQGIDLMTKEVAADAKYGASGSPTIIFNEGDYSGGRAPADFQSAICCGFNNQPAECSQAVGSAAAAASGSCG